MEQPQTMILLFEVVGQLFCICLLGDKQEDAPRRCELHEAPSQPVPLAGARGENLHNLSNVFICLKGEISHKAGQKGQRGKEIQMAEEKEGFRCENKKRPKFSFTRGFSSHLTADHFHSAEKTEVK